MRRTKSTTRTVVLTVGCALIGAVPIRAQDTEPLDLTLESAVEIAMENSYRVRQMQLGIEQTRSRLRAERAELKSQVSLDLSAPQFEAVSEYQYSDDLGIEELVHQDSRMWEMNLAVRQPVILFGYATNGYLSLNNRTYRYTQVQEGQPFTRYYNRSYIEYEQPFFQPNELENELEEAELDLEGAELGLQENVVDLVGDVADDYYELFELAYQRVIYSDRVANLEAADEAARAMARADSSRTIEIDRIQVEIANARERLRQVRSDFQLEASRLKQDWRLEPSDSIVVEPVLEVTPVEVDLDRAMRYATTLRPRLRELAIELRESELDLEETASRNSFRVDLELTYGREMADPRLGALWEQPRNSYTVGVEAYLPIWDWGARDARIEAERISLQRAELDIEETRNEIESDINNVVRVLQQYQERALSMEENLALARDVFAQSLERYRRGEVALLDLLQSINGQTQTAENFLDTYLGYQRARLDLQQMTYYDFERNIPLLERFEAASATSR